jgi:serine/threonine protein kinase
MTALSSVPVRRFFLQGEQFCIPQLLNRRYAVQSVLAAGGFGVLFEALDTRICHRKVLIKANRYPANLFHFAQNLARERAIDEQRERLKLEMKMLRVAQQRNIAGTPILIDLVEGPSPQLYGPHLSTEQQTFTLDEDLCQQEPYLVLSRIEGETLAQACVTNRFRRDILTNVKTIIIQLAGILHSFHQYELTGSYKLSFVYQDLKPDNVIWTPLRSCVLIDFGGFAARTNTDMVPHNLFVSTPPYEPPEFRSQLPPEETILPRADVYSLGVTLLHLLLGGVPIDPETGELACDLDALPCPQEWKQFLKKMLDPVPDTRWQSMEQVQKAAYQLPTPRKNGRSR